MGSEDNPVKPIQTGIFKKKGAISKIVEIILRPLKFIYKIFTKHLMWGLIIMAIGTYVTWKFTDYKEKQIQLELVNKAKNQMIATLKNNNLDNEIRLTAAVGLAKMGMVKILKESWEDNPPLTNIIKEFDEEFKKQQDKDFNENLLIDLRNTKGDRKLRDLDQKFRIRGEINSILRIMREQREWIQGDGLTNHEKGIIRDLKVLENIDSIIDTLSTIMPYYDESVELRPDFRTVSSELLVDLEDFYSDIKYSQIQDDIFYAELVELRKNVKASYVKYKSINSVSSQIEKYQEIINLLVRLGADGAGEEFRDLIQNPQVAKSIKVKSIEGLGVLGGEEDLELLVSLCQQDDPDIRVASLKALGMVLSKKNELKDLEDYSLRIYGYE